MSTELEYLQVKHFSGTNSFVVDSDGLHMFAGEWVHHDYIPINPDGVTFQYDITYSVDAGNQIHIGWERYDANKTSRTNNACVYPISVKPSTDLVKVHAQGTVNLSTDGVNPAAFIRLRILNAWSGTESDSQKKLTIHSLSLRAVPNGEVPNRQIYKNGQFLGDHFRESFNGIASIYKSGFIDGTSIYEY